jgi:hypothetical protein
VSNAPSFVAKPAEGRQAAKAVMCDPAAATRDDGEDI